tara:strand:+ start:60 stop:482 length:423 start_codon:yes stop_codon:yes gene_type:complete
MTFFFVIDRPGQLLAIYGTPKNKWESGQTAKVWDAETGAVVQESVNIDPEMIGNTRVVAGSFGTLAKAQQWAMPHLNLQEKDLRWFASPESMDAADTLLDISASLGGKRKKSKRRRSKKKRKSKKRKSKKRKSKTRRKSR